MNIANGINKYMNLSFGFLKKIPKKFFIIILYALCSIASGCILYLINRIPEKIILNLSLDDNAEVDSLIVKCGFNFSIDTDSWSLHTKRGNVDVANFYIAFKDNNEDNVFHENLRIISYKKDTMVLSTWDIKKSYFEKNGMPLPNNFSSRYNGPSFTVSYLVNDDCSSKPKDRPYEEQYLKSSGDVIYHAFSHLTYDSLFHETFTQKHVTLCFPASEKDSVKREVLTIRTNKRPFLLFSLFDISQSMVFFDTNDLFKGSVHKNFMGETDELGLYFGSSSIISHVNVEPDRYVHNGIEYNDTTKLANLDYLQFHVEYTDFNNLQDLRSFVLTTLTVTFFGLFSKSIWTYYRNRRGKKQKNKNKGDKNKRHRRRRRGSHFQRNRK